MKQLHLFGVIGAVAVAAMILAPTLVQAVATVPPTWTIADRATKQNYGGAATFTVTNAGGAIPNTRINTESNAVVGFGWVNLAASPVPILAVTAHPTFKDSAQNPINWHLHTATLTSGGNGFDLCINSFTDVTTASGRSLTNGVIKASGNTMSVTVPTSSLPANFDDLDNAAGFVINVDSGTTCPDLGGVRLGVNLANNPGAVVVNDTT